MLRRIEIDMQKRPRREQAQIGRRQADAGEIASAAFSPALGKVAALAYVRTQFAEPGTELRLAPQEGLRDVRVLVL